jgi:hypothetical protein
VSISPTFYVQLFCVQIPKAQKNTDSETVFFALLGSVGVKAEHKMLVKLTPERRSSRFLVTSLMNSD